MRRARGAPFGSYQSTRISILVFHYACFCGGMANRTQWAGCSPRAGASTRLNNPGPTSDVWERLDAQMPDRFVEPMTQQFILFYFRMTPQYWLRTLETEPTEQSNHYERPPGKTNHVAVGQYQATFLHLLFQLFYQRSTDNSHQSIHLHEALPVPPDVYCEHSSVVVKSIVCFARTRSASVSIRSARKFLLSSSHASGRSRIVS